MIIRSCPYDDQPCTGDQSDDCHVLCVARSGIRPIQFTPTPTPPRRWYWAIFGWWTYSVVAAFVVGFGLGRLL